MTEFFHPWLARKLAAAGWSEKRRYCDIEAFDKAKSLGYNITSQMRYTIENLDGILLHFPMCELKTNHVKDYYGNICFAFNDCVERIVSPRDARNICGENAVPFGRIGENTILLAGESGKIYDDEGNMWETVCEFFIQAVSYGEHTF